MWYDAQCQEYVLDNGERIDQRVWLTVVAPLIRRLESTINAKFGYGTQPVVEGWNGDDYLRAFKSAHQAHDHRAMDAAHTLARIRRGEFRIVDGRIDFGPGTTGGYGLVPLRTAPVAMPVVAG